MLKIPIIKPTVRWRMLLVSCRVGLKQNKNACAHSSVKSPGNWLYVTCMIDLRFTSKCDRVNFRNYPRAGVHSGNHTPRDHRTHPVTREKDGYITEARESEKPTTRALRKRSNLGNLKTVTQIECAPYIAQTAPTSQPSTPASPILKQQEHSWKNSAG